MCAKYESSIKLMSFLSLSFPLRPSQQDSTGPGQPPGQSEMVSFKASQTAKAPQLTEPVAPDGSNVVQCSPQAFCLFQNVSNMCDQ